MDQEQVRASPREEDRTGIQSLASKVGKVEGGAPVKAKGGIVNEEIINYHSFIVFPIHYPG